MKVAVVGAGVAGLTAARALQDAGHTVTVFDKGRVPGGRLSTKKLLGDRLADAGAQFFTVRSTELDDVVKRWRAGGVVHEWCRGFDGDDGHPRYAVRGGTARLAETMAEGLDVRCSTHIGAIRLTTGGAVVSWPAAHGHPAGQMTADVAIVTTPVAQAATLIGEEGDLPSISYQPTFSLLVALDRPVAVSPSGGRQETDDPVWSFIGDNVAKGTSPSPCLTFHTTAAFAEDHFDQPLDLLTEELLEATRPFRADASVIDSKVHRWRYATPINPYLERTYDASGGRNQILLAGDAFGGPRVEGAYLSGLAAAGRL